MIFNLLVIKLSFINDKDLPTCKWQSWVHAGMLPLFSRVQLFVTLWTIARQALLSTGFSRPGYWSGLPCPPSGDPVSPAFQVDSLPADPLGKAGTRCQIT